MWLLLVTFGQSTHPVQQQRLEAFCDRLKNACDGYEFDYVRLSTGKPLDQALMAYLDRRGYL
jgi:hypothetical protein